MSPVDTPQLPNAPAPPPMFGQQAGTKRKKQSDSMIAPTFLGTGGATPTATGGQKTLLGQ